MPEEAVANLIQEVQNHWLGCCKTNARMVAILMGHQEPLLETVKWHKLVRYTADEFLE